MYAITQKSINVFCCYSHEDKKLLDKLANHISVLRQSGRIASWHEREVSEDKRWAKSIDYQILDNANIILLLISSDFVASDYCYGREGEYIQKLHGERKTHVIPVILRPALYKDAPFSDLLSLPTGGKPITSWKDRDEAFVNVVEGIQSVIDKINSEFENTAAHINKSYTSILTVTVPFVDVLDSPEAKKNIFASTAPQIPEKKLSKPEMISNLTQTSSTQKYVSKSTRQKKSRKKPLIPEEQLFLFPSSDAPDQQASNRRTKATLDYEKRIVQAQNFIENDQPNKALNTLDISFDFVPTDQRWRLTALRGRCYFGLGRMIPARDDYSRALSEKPEVVPNNEIAEELSLYIRSADTERELNNLDEAQRLYRSALARIDHNAPLHYVADAHWGLALVLLEQASKMENTNQPDMQKEMLQRALKHAENARVLYEATGEALNAFSVSCDIALIEQLTGNLDKARVYLQDILETWLPMLNDSSKHPAINHRYRNGPGSIVAAASCYLAGVELEAHHYEKALEYAHQAHKVAQRSDHLWRAEAAMMQGKILEARNHNDQNAEKSFRQAVTELSQTDWLAARMYTHNLLGSHLMKKGRWAEGEEELDKARRLSQ
jgi:tetratricopeptide (TPR) repeat protein